MKPIDNNGRELDAIFSVDPTPEGAYVILESRGGSTGGRPPRNEDYAKGLELLLTRLGMNSATLIDVEVYSGVTKKWPIADRLIGSSSFSFPLPLASLTDKSRFRNELGVASAALGRSLEKTSGGNPTKRLRLTLEWPSAVGRSATELETLLARAPAASANDPPVKREEPTADPDELEERVHRAKRVLRSRRGDRPPPLASGQPTSETTTTTRFVRDPEVVAWILEKAGGICEVCALPAPFEDKHGDPYLEVHHVRPLADGGPDQADNAIAVCPNCHRRMHYSADKDAIRAATITQLKRLNDHPKCEPRRA